MKVRPGSVKVGRTHIHTLREQPSEARVGRLRAGLARGVVLVAGLVRLARARGQLREARRFWLIHLGARWEDSLSDELFGDRA